VPPVVEAPAGAAESSEPPESSESPEPSESRESSEPPAGDPPIPDDATISADEPSAADDDAPPPPAEPTDPPGAATTSDDPAPPAEADPRLPEAAAAPPPARHAAPSVTSPTALTPVVDLGDAGPATPDPPATGDEAPFTSVVLVGGAPPELGDLSRPPLPPGDGHRTDPHAPPNPASAPLISGVTCKNGHFTDPSTPYCTVCGVVMEAREEPARSGPRPPLGVLVLDDGATFRLDAGYVVGREPDRDPEVLAGRARPLRIADPDGVVSRIHARVDLEGWAVTVVDLGSANGTHLCPAGGETWTRIPPRTPVSITPGTRVVFGRRGFRYETPRTA
jgi:hypothetical protein